MRTCPICKQKLYHNSWSGEQGLEEYIEECKNNKCGKYLDHWYFGQHDIKIAHFEATFTDHGYMKEKEIEIADKNWRMFNKILRYYRKRKSR